MVKAAYCVKRIQPFYLLLLLAVFSGNSFGQIYKCLINGETVYTDRACSGSTSQDLALTPLNVMPGTTAGQSARNAGGETGGQYDSNRWYIDHRGYRDAVKASEAWNAPLLIYGYTDWCPYCKKFEAALLPAPKVSRALSRYVKVKLNPEHGEQDKALFEKWGGTGYPALFIQYGASSSPMSLRGPFVGKRIMSESEFLEIIAHMEVLQPLQ